MKNIQYVQELEEIAKKVKMQFGNILVTGATGLIGSMFIEAILTYNKTTDRKIHVYAMSRSMESLEKRFCNWNKEKTLHLVQHDVSNKINLDVEFDYIIHLASNADPKNYAEYPAETISTNVVGTFNVLELAIINPKAVVFLASTMEVYGDLEAEGSGIREDQYGLINFNEIRQGYPESKRVCELMGKSYAQEYGVDCRIGRFGYIYGPTRRASDSKVIFQFINNVLAGEDILMKSQGTQRRTYCYCMDAISAILIILQDGTKGDVYNIADEKSNVSISELANIVAELGGVHMIRTDASEVEKKGFSKAVDAVLDNKKLKSLGWEPHIHIRDGISRVISMLGE